MIRRPAQASSKGNLKSRLQEVRRGSPVGICGENLRSEAQIARAKALRKESLWWLEEQQRQVCLRREPEGAARNGLRGHWAADLGRAALSLWGR